MSESQLMRVTAIRSQNPVGMGGCIFSAVPINEQGAVLDAKEYCVVRASGALLGETRVQAGQWWCVSGEEESYIRTGSGPRVTERQINAEDLTLELPSGEHIVTLMAESDDFRGIGSVKARKLWETFQEQLYDLLDRGDVAALTQVLGEDVAIQAVAAWQLHGDAKTLQWLQKQGFDAVLGRKLIACFGVDAPNKIEEDPYRLLSFCGGWTLTDAFARKNFGLAENDPRRLQGAIEEALYRLLGDGHTAARNSMLMDRLQSVLGVQSDSFRWRTLVPDALVTGFGNGSYLIGIDHDIHPLGAYVMEMSVAKALASRLVPRADAPLLPPMRVDTLIAAYEVEERLVLNAEQRGAVHGGLKHPLMLITGGAGVGKTTVLKALYRGYDDSDVRVFQMALAGRAAKRLQEATERPATTIASFLRNVATEDLAGPVAVVVDEASMVDIITMYRLCELLPEHVRLVLVGDPAQLMPVGPGLVLHVLAQESAIPHVELKIVKRHGGEIARTALSIREGVWLDLVTDESAPIAFVSEVALVRGADGETRSPVAEAVLRLYLQDPENTQILTPRKNGFDGVKCLNLLCQSVLTSRKKRLLLWSDEHGCTVNTGFHLGDPVLCTRNLWDWGLQNGSLGRLVDIEEAPRPLFNDKGDPIGNAIAWVEWDDGERRPLLEAMLDDLQLGYAITVHKAQGSQWPRIIVCLTGNRMLDRTLIYTAVTRAERQVLLVGDVEAVRQAVVAPPRAHHREVGLGGLLRGLLKNGAAHPDS